MQQDSRTAALARETKETKIEVSIDLDAQGEVSAETGLPFFDHMLNQLGRHGGWSLRVRAEGDREVDAHHTVEDVGIVLGQCFAEALGSKVGVRRFATLPRRWTKPWWKWHWIFPAVRFCTTRLNRGEKSWATRPSIPSSWKSSGGLSPPPPHLRFT